MYNLEKKTQTSENEVPLESENSALQVVNQKLIKYDILVFCHLRWGFVYQRPQHIISRLAKTYSILFIEEPISFDAGEEGKYELEKITSTLQVLKPKVKNIKDIGPLLKGLLKTTSIEIGWFYSPAFSVLIPEFSFGTIVHDCMDELALFKGADKELHNQEQYLFSKADIVFTGGKALYESKVKSHDNVHCFPSSVDQDHFEQAFMDIEIPGDIKNIASPIVGYIGVIDERIDMQLLYDTAGMHTNVSFVMLGPLAKIGEEDLPKSNNIHYLGMKSYAELPNYLKAFDVAMMPFALNDATKYISPTKTLEYMAAGKPIISTAIKDVVRDYENCIYIVKTAEDFSAAICKIIYAKLDHQVKEYKQILEKTSWSTVVNKMEKLFKQD